MVDFDERCKIFEKELELIFDERVREFTRLCLFGAPDYFFVNCPASSTGKYHPLNELGADGTMIHTKKVFTLAYELCRGLGCEERRDEILSACIIHDLLKQGKTRSGHTIKTHPGLAAELVQEIQEQTQTLNEESYQIIKNCVGFHYGLWSIAPWKKDLDEYTPEELCVYMSDYVASKRCVEVNYRR
jgi:hypothetical protein